MTHGNPDSIDSYREEILHKLNAGGYFK
jgi:hypothetical protein